MYSLKNFTLRQFSVCENVQKGYKFYIVTCFSLDLVEARFPLQFHRSEKIPICLCSYSSIPKATTKN